MCATVSHVRSVSISGAGSCSCSFADVREPGAHQTGKDKWAEDCDL